MAQRCLLGHPAINSRSSAILSAGRVVGHQFVIAVWRAKEAESTRMNPQKTTLAILATLSVSLALADDFKTINGTVRIGSTPDLPTPAIACFIGGIVGNGPFACTVSINPVTGQLGLGACISSARFKKDIDPMDKTSEAIYSLKPVTFRYKNDETNTQQWGLIAEEVAKVNPALIAMDKEGKPMTVRYEQINAMLLNEFLKEHKKVQEQESKIENQQATIAELKSTVAQQQRDFQATIAKLKESVTAQLKEQAAQIEKVSAQLEVSKPAAQTVANN